MSTKTVAFAVIAVVLVACVGAGAWYVMEGNDDPAGDGVVVTDLRGREVTIQSDVDKIVCLSASSVRLVCYMGAYDKIVGVDSMDALDTGSPANYYMATYRTAYNISELPSVGGEENYKDIIETGAQLIISSSTDRSVLDSLQSNTGIPVIGIAAEGNVDVDDEIFKQNIQLLGKALGLEERAETLLNGIDNLLNELASYKESSNVTADCYIGGMFYMMQGGLLKTTGNYVSFEWTPANNVMPDSNGGNPYDIEIKSLVDSGAQYIFIDNMTYNSSKSIFDTNKEVLQSLEAVANGQIYSTLVYKYYGTNWESELMNAYYIGSVLDPETYDFSIEDKCNEILSLFYPDSDVTYQDVAEKQSPGYAQLDW